MNTHIFVAQNKGQSLLLVRPPRVHEIDSYILFFKKKKYGVLTALGHVPSVLTSVSAESPTDNPEERPTR